MGPPNSPALDPLMPPGPNHTHVQWNREWLAEMLVAEAAKHAREKLTPAPRLVGIETNPGPGPSSKIGSEVAAALGNLLAQTIKKKPRANKKKKIAVKTKRKKAPTGTKATMQQHTFATSLAPVAVGNTVRSGHTPSSFKVAANTLMFGFQNGPTGLPIFRSATGFPGSCGSFNMDPLGGSTTAINFRSFPPNITALAARFMKYRITRLKLRYVPTANTSTSGNIVFSSVPEVVSADLSLSYEQVAGMGTAVSFPVWQTTEFEPLGLDKGWKYLDSNISSAQPALRQECPGSCHMSVIGVPTTANLIFGIVYGDYEIEFNTLAEESVLPGHSQPQQGTSSASSSSALSVPYPTVRCESNEEPEHGLAESVYLPSSLLSSMGLKRA